MSQCADFDIERIVPHVDLVLFDNVLSCYPCNKNITANYTLGDAVRATTWDWVGIFRTDWRYLGEYLAYSWVPQPTDVTNIRRHGIVFPFNSHKIPQNDDEQYSFLYIAHGNHVVGVSSPFRVTDEEVIEDMYIGRLFHISSSPDEEPSFQQLTCSGFYDTYDIIDETPKAGTGAIPKRKASSKRKIVNVYRDSTTLMNIAPIWPEKLRILDVHPVVKEYMDNRVRSLVTSSERASSERQIVPVYDIHWKNTLQQRETHQKGRHQLPPSGMASITYPDILSITAGPESFMLGIKSNNGTCTNCSIAKTLIKDFLDKDAYKSKRITDLENETNFLRIQTTEMSNDTTRLDKEATVGILDWCLEQIHDDNKVLRMRIKDLESLLTDERTKRLQDAPPLKSMEVCTEATETQSTTDQDGWTYKEPRRIERLKKAANRHSRNIHLLHQTVEAKNFQITSLKEENLKLRRVLRAEKEQTQVFCKLAEELNLRIKTVLAERAKDRTNEWRRFVRYTQSDSPCHTPCPSSDNETPEKSSDVKVTRDMPKHHLKNKHMSKVLRAEKQPKSKLHRERSQAEQCPTCGLKFSLKADKRVIEEHMHFHSPYRN